jgi:Uma2 family endonuclease
MMTPSGADHGRIAMTIGALLHQHVRERRLGTVFGAETGFVLSRNPDTLRAPDAAFVKAERADRISADYFDGAPDLAVEVISPSDRESYVTAKATQWLEAGARAVWLIRPVDRSVTVLGPAAEPRRLTEHDTLDGAPVLPGFACAVREIFE